MKVLVLNGLIIAVYFMAIMFFPDKNDVRSTGTTINIKAGMGEAVGMKPCENVPDDKPMALVDFLASICAGSR